MSAPLESPEFKTLYVGDINDDDAEVMESYTNPASDGPPNVYTEAIPDQSVTPPKVAERLLCDTSVIKTAWAAPVPIQPADLNRTMFMCKAISSTATDFISISSEFSSLQSIDYVTAPKLAARIYPGDGWVPIGPYTGPIFATAVGASADVTFSWMAVSS